METCFKCGSKEIRAHASTIFQCEECGARVAHGERMPRIVVQPHTDRRFVVVTIADQNVIDSADAEPPTQPVQVVIDRALARMLGHNLISVG